MQMHYHIETDIWRVGAIADPERAQQIADHLTETGIHDAYMVKRKIPGGARVAKCDCLEGERRTCAPQAAHDAEPARRDARP